MEKKRCKKCGRELPLSSFRRNVLSKDGYVDTCKDCSARKYRDTKRKNDDLNIPPKKVEGGNPELAKFTPRELMAELKVRGFKGTLSIVREVVL